MYEEHAALEIGGEVYEVVAGDGREAMSALFEVALECRVVGREIDPSAWAGGPASLVLRDGFGRERTIRGVVAEAAALASDEGILRLSVALRPEAYLLSLGRGCRVFLDKSVVAIVDEVLAGVKHRWELSGDYPAREYVVQYREDDWTFVKRWLEREGIAFWFDHESGSELVLTDDTRAAPELPGGSYLPFHEDTGMVADHEVVVALGSRAALGPTKFSIASFDPARPALKVAGGAGEGSLEIYDAPGGGPESPAECARQASLMAEAARASAGGISGEATLARLSPGRVIEIGEHPVARLNGRFLLTAVAFRLRQRRRDGDTSEPSLHATFEAIEAGLPFRPLPTTPEAAQAGLQSGIVVGPPGEEIHTDASGRVRIQLHWDREGQRDDRAGKWMRVAQRGTHDSMLLPRVGWNVLTFNEEGAVDAPSVLSRIHDAEHPPAYPLPANKTRVVWKTATSPADGTHNEIYYEDIKGAEEMFINASRDMNLLTQHVKTENVVRDCARLVENDRRLEVGADLIERVLGNQTVVIGGNEQTTIGGDNEEETRGSETISIAGNRKVKTAEGNTIGVKGNRSLSVGAAMLDNSFGTISGGSDVTVHMTGGAVIRATPASVSEDTGGVSLQAIGGAKLEFTKAERSIDVSKQLVELIGGLWLAKTDETYLDDARETASWSVGAAIDSKAPEICIEAAEKIEISCAKSALVITAESVEIRGTELSLSEADSLEVITKKVEHN